MNLTRTQKLAIDFLAKSPLRETFYWTGGTLLTYHYLRHRESKEQILKSIEDYFQKGSAHFLRKNLK